MLDLFQPRNSPLHHMPAGPKLAALAVLGTLVFLTDSLAIITGYCLAALALYPLAQLSARHAWRQIRPVLWILIALFLLQAIFADWTIGLFVVLRFAALLLFAGIVTLTTRATDMISALERGFVWLSIFGLSPAKISLTLSLGLRFIPVLSNITQDVREAQKARGMDRNILALAVPVVVRTLKMADEISQAIDARGFIPPPTQKNKV